MPYSDPNKLSQRRMAIRKGELPIPDGVRHGRSCRANYGCKCYICVEDDNEYQRSYHEKYPHKQKEYDAKILAKDGVKEYCSKRNASKAKKLNELINNPKKGYWTAYELETIQREDITILQMSMILNRPYGNVLARRSNLMRGGDRIQDNRKFVFNEQHAAIAMSNLHTTKQAAHLIGCSTATVERFRRQQRKQHHD